MKNVHLEINYTTAPKNIWQPHWNDRKSFDRRRGICRRKAKMASCLSSIITEKTLLISQSFAALLLLCNHKIEMRAHYGWLFPKFGHYPTVFLRVNSWEKRGCIAVLFSFHTRENLQCRLITMQQMWSDFFKLYHVKLWTLVVPTFSSNEWKAGNALNYICTSMLIDSTKINKLF